MSTESQELLKQLTYKIRSIKGTITKFNSFLDRVNSETFDAIQINTRLSKIKELWSQYFDAQMQIELIQETESMQSDNDKFEEDYFNSIARAEKALIAHSKGISSSNEPQNIKNQVRLPQISLPSFSGAFEEWLPFYETFSSLIHSNDTLSNVQKFHYLKSCLKGEAINCIQELQISSANYEIAWSTLKGRFDNKRLIIKKHIQAIHELPNCIHENVGILRNILDSVQKHTRALKSLNRPVEHWSDWLIYLITAKLDKTTNKDWEASIKPNHLPDFDEMLDFLSRK